jgi:integrase
MRRAALTLGRHGHRDSTLLLVLFSHGLRVSEAIRLNWVEVNLDQAYLSVRRLKNGNDGEHRLDGAEVRALRRLKREYPATFSLRSDTPEVLRGDSVISGRIKAWTNKRLSSTASSWQANSSESMNDLMTWSGGLTHRAPIS